MARSRRREETFRSLRVSDQEAEELLDDLDAGPAAGGASRRRHNRFEYRIEECRVAVQQPGDSAPTVFVVHTRNISANGLSFLQGGFVHSGSRCTVELVGPGGSQTVGARVIHCRYLERGVHEVAVMFDAEILTSSFCPDAKPCVLLIAPGADLEPPSVAAAPAEVAVDDAPADERADAAADADAAESEADLDADAGEAADPAPRPGLAAPLVLDEGACARGDATAEALDAVGVKLTRAGSLEALREPDPGVTYDLVLVDLCLSSDIDETVRKVRSIVGAAQVVAMVDNEAGPQREVLQDRGFADVVQGPLDAPACAGLLGVVPPGRSVAA